MIDSLFPWLGARQKSLRAQLAEKDAEIAELKRRLENKSLDISDLLKSNRRLSIESAEMRAAYNGLKEILRKRAEAAEAEAAAAAEAKAAAEASAESES